MMTVKNAVGFCCEGVIAGLVEQAGSPPIVRQRLQRVTKPDVIEGLRARSEIRDAIDFCRMTDEAVHRPPEGIVRTGTDTRTGTRTGTGNPNARCVRRHAERRNPRVIAPQHEPDLLADDGVDITDDNLSDQISVEE